VTTSDDAVVAVVAALDAAGIPHMIVGSLASNFHGMRDPGVAAADLTAVGVSIFFASRSTACRYNPPGSPMRLAPGASLGVALLGEGPSTRQEDFS
jgi:hypothetical protein